MRKASVLAGMAFAFSSSCSTLDQLARLPDLDFHLDRTSDGRLAGVEIDDVRRVSDLQASDYVLIADAVRRGSLPLRFDLHVGAENPAPYNYDLMLERLEWTLLLEDRETVTGILDRNIQIQPSGTTDIPVPVEIDLLDFFEHGASDLAQLALRVAGLGGDPTTVRLRARPTVRTPFGSYRFPNEITIASRDV
jgi:hypothetical protein